MDLDRLQAEIDRMREEEEEVPTDSPLPLLTSLFPLGERPLTHAQAAPRGDTAPAEGTSEGGSRGGSRGGSGGGQEGITVGGPRGGFQWDQHPGLRRASTEKTPTRSSGG
eukprot:774649-Prorocentrum_minimum.AAC.1